MAVQISSTELYAHCLECVNNCTVHARGSTIVCILYADSVSTEHPMQTGLLSSLGLGFPPDCRTEVLCP